METAFFKAAPEFSEAGGAIRADMIGPGKILVRVDSSGTGEGMEDPVIGAWPSFIDRDIQSNPGHLVAFVDRELAVLDHLVEHVVVSDDYRLPENMTP